MAPIVGSQRKPSSAFVCTTNADLSSAERKQKSDHLGASLLLMQRKGAPSPSPHPRKRRFPHTRKAFAAVKILCWDLAGLINYKAITLIDLVRRIPHLCLCGALAAWQ